ncbi:hypothetical protein AAZX31_06G051700 [Glycine max]|uniref:DUF7880 domain-containing protein n=2 Tax=Glycine subgen. Soja TaxID=1462606 RepID=I1K8G2_SOYBN|nr:uncharacterized protein LOC100787776 [Glycine max]XP_028235089.1 uncharacterized protein LOC114414850 [Glycine soja]KAG5018515.1 hypothetical protein JHK87_014370 [Glycine soja]KAG5030857.1 hypothetical protein JHK85_014839 [Glycine max]KAG5147580.1 hypothetical protein JHK82_014461 [Glycine max]KAH1124326.1 hypothetical protein GYH30_014179 [Glycine max]KAH1244634.1 hypothetical protein GmHk_06G015207 [Glycine max]|eukprot:XP_003526058.1 uncharacterized protein LOC100787776 [Glycine max]
MASLGTPAHVSSNKKPLHRWSWKAKRVRCAVSPPTWREGRRTVSLSLVLSHLLLIPNRDTALASPFDKYVKRKKLDPLEVYIPAVILTEFQIKDLEKTLEDEEPQFALCRSLLRSGPAASLRVNIRAVAQYASDSGNGKTAFNDVDECLRSLEELDSLLLHASRNDPEASVKSMKAKINSALGALDSLLQTVPSDVLSKGKVIADSYREPEDEETGSLDPDLKQLESIL